MKECYRRNKEGRYIIPIKLQSYDELYDELDFRSKEYRKLNMNIHNFIKDVYEEISWKEDSEILFVLAKIIRSQKEEEKVKEAFENYYEIKIIQELLNIIATVLLWQVVSMIFVESSILRLSKDIT